MLILFKSNISMLQSKTILHSSQKLNCFILLFIHVLSLKEKRDSAESEEKETVMTKYRFSCVTTHDICKIVQHDVNSN